MKVKVISRSTDEFTRERSNDIQRVFRNFDPSLRTQEKEAEYVRALNATKLDKLLPRERKNHEYREAVKNHYKHPPEVKCILRNRHLPKPIFKAYALRRIMGEVEGRKDERRRAHSALGSMPKESIRKKRIVKTVE